MVKVRYNIPYSEETSVYEKEIKELLEYLDVEIPHQEKMAELNALSGYGYGEAIAENKLKVLYKIKEILGK